MQFEFLLICLRYCNFYLLEYFLFQVRPPGTALTTGDRSLSSTSEWWASEWLGCAPAPNPHGLPISCLGGASPSNKPMRPKRHCQLLPRFRDFCSGIVLQAVQCYACLSECSIKKLYGFHGRERAGVDGICCFFQRQFTCWVWVPAVLGAQEKKADKSWCGTW